MITAGIIVHNNTILLNTSPIPDPKDTSLVKSALITIKNPDSKVVQVGHLRLGIASIKYKTSLMVFGTFGTDVEPKMLLDSAGDLAESFLRNFAGRDLTDETILTSLKRNFVSMIDEFNEKIGRNKRMVVEIDQNLKEGIDISKQSMDKFIERGNNLTDMYNKSTVLNSEALNFEKSGRRLKQDLQRQKLKMYAVVSAFVLFTFYFFLRVL